MNDQILITNIQRFSLHDGPGIRTTVFLKGCSLRCPWCSNPENLSSEIQDYYKDGINGKYGKFLSADEIADECLKDRAYYEGKTDNWEKTSSDELDLLPGGVTFSGGEALNQARALIPVFMRLHQEGIHLAVETCLFVPGDLLAIAIEHIDLFYVDVKILDHDKCKEMIRGDLELFLTNLETLMSSSKPVVIRIPVIGNRTDSKENRSAVKNLLEKYKDRILKIELIKEHNLGESKYKSLGLEMSYVGVTDALLETYKSELEILGIPVEVCKI